MKRAFFVVVSLLIASTAWAAIRLPTNRAALITVGPFFDVTDGVTPETAMTVTNISGELFKDSDAGGAGVAPTRVALTITAAAGTNDMVHITNDTVGCYSLELTASQLNFKGRARLVLIDTDVMCPWWTDIVVEPNDVYDAFVSGTVGIATSEDTVAANLTQIDGHTLADTGNQMADGFQYFFNVAVPALTVASVNQTGDAYARLGTPTGTDIASDIAGFWTEDLQVESATPFTGAWYLKLILGQF